MKLPSWITSLRSEWHKRRRDALRLGLQGGVSASAFYLLMTWLGLPEVFVGTISAVYILQESSDGTIGSAMGRLSATLVGSLIAIACLFVLPHGYGTAVALFVTMFAMNTIAALKSNWQYGIVAAIALALGSQQNVIEVSIDRGISIGLGAAVGLAVALLIWPDRAAKRFERHVRHALAALADRLEHAGTATEKGADPLHPGHEARYQEAVRLAAEAKDVMRIAPARDAEERLKHLRRLHNSIVILDRTLEGAEAAPIDGDDELLRGEMGKVAAAVRALAEGKLDDIPQLADPAGIREGDREATLRFGMRELNLELQKLAGESRA
ncbi:MAG: FUSC family protein [Limimaricola soesokkakensis]|uniref:FUSC family protein n=1 Tax=Limimaricola soesokkakensis TaxID=1343159 RepID=UPI004059B351